MTILVISPAGQVVGRVIEGTETIVATTEEFEGVLRGFAESPEIPAPLFPSKGGRWRKLSRYVDLGMLCALWSFCYTIPSPIASIQGNSRHQETLATHLTGHALPSTKI